MAMDDVNRHNDEVQDSKMADRAKEAADDEQLFLAFEAVYASIPHVEWLALSDSRECQVGGRLSLLWLGKLDRCCFTRDCVGGFESTRFRSHFSPVDKERQIKTRSLQR